MSRWTSPQAHDPIFIQQLQLQSRATRARLPRGATCVLSTCPEACPRGRLSGCCSCGRPARLRVVARRDTPVPALSRGPVCVPRPSRVTWWFCLAPVPFVSASARWFTCACSRFLPSLCVSQLAQSLAWVPCACRIRLEWASHGNTSFPLFRAARPPRLHAHFTLSLALGGEGSRTPPPPPRARVREISGAREHANCPCALCVPRTLS